MASYIELHDVLFFELHADLLVNNSYKPKSLRI